MKKTKEIELMPNCSELVMRLDIKDKSKILKELKTIGIEEVEFEERYYYSTTPKNKEKIRLLVDKDNPNLPDFKYMANIRLYKNDDTKDWIVSAHQHCQHQLFPTLKKIQNHFGGEFYSDDGGSTGDYEEWDGKPIEDHNKWVKVLKKKEDWTFEDKQILAESKQSYKNFERIWKMYKIKMPQKKKDQLREILVMEAL